MREKLKLNSGRVLKSNKVNVKFDEFSYCFYLNDGIDSLVNISIDNKDDLKFLACLTHRPEFYPDYPKNMSIILFCLPDNSYTISVNLIDYIINIIIDKFVEVRQGVSGIGKFLNPYEHIHKFIVFDKKYYGKLDEIATKLNNSENFKKFVINGICIECNRKIKSSISYDKRSLREIMFLRCEKCGIYCSIIYYFKSEYELMDFYESDIEEV